MNGNSEGISFRFCHAAVLRRLRGQRAKQTDKILTRRFPAACSRVRFNHAVKYCLYGLLILVWMATLQPSAAEPTSSIQYLMREPVSMMDWGIKNIEDHLFRQRTLLIRNEKQLFEPEPTITTVYNWEENQIQISIGLRTSATVHKTSQGISDIRSHVEYVITYLRGSLTMKPFDAFFRHRGFRSKDSPRNLESELTGLTLLIVSVRDGDANILSRCKARLTGSDMVWMTIGEP